MSVAAGEADHDVRASVNGLTFAILTFAAFIRLFIPSAEKLLVIKQHVLEAIGSPPLPTDVG